MLKEQRMTSLKMVVLCTIALGIGFLLRSVTPILADAIFATSYIFGTSFIVLWLFAHALDRNGAKLIAKLDKSKSPYPLIRE
jgi:hypothetical protein